MRECVCIDEAWVKFKYAEIGGGVLNTKSGEAELCTESSSVSVWLDCEEPEKDKVGGITSCRRWNWQL